MGPTCDKCSYYQLTERDPPVVYWPGIGKTLCEMCAEEEQPDRGLAETSDLPDLEDADAVLAWLDKE